jgi:hypothetical protein
MADLDGEIHRELIGRATISSGRPRAAAAVARWCAILSGLCADRFPTASPATPGWTDARSFNGAANSLAAAPQNNIANSPHSRPEAVASH